MGERKAMTIIEMLNIWSELQSSVHSAASKLGYPQKSIALQGGGGTWGQAIDDWEEENNAKIKGTLDALIYGEGRDTGILTMSERMAVEHHHISAVYVSKRTNIADDYSRALFKLKPAMERRGFIVD